MRSINPFFCSFDKTIIYPVPGGWVKKGATFVNLKKVKKEMLMDALSWRVENSCAGKHWLKNIFPDKNLSCNNHSQRFRASVGNVEI
jgi:hypothetical protein